MTTIRSHPTVLTQLANRVQRIRDRVCSVAYKYQTACYLVGRPGTSKTYTVRQELDRLKVMHTYRNARMTPMGLFELIAESPEHILVLDDIGTLFKSDQAMQILMAATDGAPTEPRLVTYKSKDKQQEVEFTGGIIAISNKPLRHDPLASAFESRAVVLEHEPTDDELAAFMRELAAKGDEDLSSKECLEVAEFVITETRAYGRRLDLRHLQKAWQDFRQHKDKRTKCSRQELVRSSLQKTACVESVPLSKRERIEQDRERVREAMRLFPNDTNRQIEYTGLTQSTFYNRRAEIESESRTA